MSLPRTPPKQRGVVLIVVLVMLVIIGMTSASVMRNALSADSVSANVRSEALASEAAQLALAYCEQRILVRDQTEVPIQEPTADSPHWEKIANWDAGATTPPKTLSVEQIRSDTASFNLQFRPQCMAERMALGSQTDSVVIVTARGFSSDYSEDKNGRAQSGSTVWLQSTLRLQ